MIFRAVDGAVQVWPMIKLIWPASLRVDIAASQEKAVIWHIRTTDINIVEQEFLRPTASYLIVRHILTILGGHNNI